MLTQRDIQVTVCSSAGSMWKKNNGLYNLASQFCVNFIIYRVFEDENKNILEMMASIIARKRVHMNMCLSMNGYRERESCLNVQN